MQIEQLVGILDHPGRGVAWFASMRLSNPTRAHQNLLAMAQALTLDLLADVCSQLDDFLPGLSDPDRALNNLERFVQASRNPLALGALLQRDRRAVPTLLQIFSTSQYLADVLVRDPESYDLLRMTEGDPVSLEILVDEVCSEVSTARDPRLVALILRRYKYRETLRIAYGDIVGEQNVVTVTRQISFLADAICRAATLFVRSDLERRYGSPLRDDGQAARFTVLALGKLGGSELNYSSDIDLIFLSDGPGRTDGRESVSNDEFFNRLARGLLRLLTEPTDLGACYRVDLRLRPRGREGPIVMATDPALRYYDVSGRTWERQAFIKARPIAGDLDLGHQFLEALEPWIYRRYLGLADIAGIKALKRRIEKRTRGEGDDRRNLKTGHGGIRDIEFAIQFLQLLNAADLPEVRTGNTLTAIARLERVGCLTMQERSILQQNYATLRKIEHRLQIMFDLQTHTLPPDKEELHKLALRMGFVDRNGQTALEAFQHDLTERTELNRRILDHLLHDAFSDDAHIEPEGDLVLDPNPSDEAISECLGGHGFQDTAAAYKNLMSLATERLSFLSTRRCRHFLAAIAPSLLSAIACTPSPDSTLLNLSRVSDSLGGKGVLWELFSFNAPSLQLYVRLCACSPYLSGLLVSNPGMADELMDSLVLDRLPTRQFLQRTLTELCRGAEDPEPILHSFKNSQHLRVGVRDILHKEDVQATHQTLSDIAEVCLQQITHMAYEQLVERFGEPRIEQGPRAGQPCEMIILALGKLGGREPNYHSDLDVVFLYEAQGKTHFPHRSKQDRTTSNQHFFSQLGQRIIKIITKMGPLGRLFELDTRLRPTGKSGSLAVSLTEFQRYFSEGRGQLWERQALCKARVVFGSESVSQRVIECVRQNITVRPWTGAAAEEIRHMRLRLEDTASRLNLKRGPGGTVDVEFLAQMLQLQFASDHPEVLQSGTLDAIQALKQVGALGPDDAEYLRESYRFLRRIETGLRLMNTAARHDLPEDRAELDRLAFLLGYQGADQILQDCQRFTQQNRRCFHRLVDAASK